MLKTKREEQQIPCRIIRKTDPPKWHNWLKTSSKGILTSRRNICIFKKIWSMYCQTFLFYLQNFRLIWIQVNLCQKLLFLHQLTHNMTKDCSLNYKFNTWKFQAQTWGEHVVYRNCFWHPEQFLYTTCFPHVLQKDEFLTKIYLYYLRCSNSKPFLFQILNLHKPLTISSFMVNSQKLNSWIKSVICQKIRSKAWLSLVEWLPKSVSKLMKP